MRVRERERRERMSKGVRRIDEGKEGDRGDQ